MIENNIIKLFDNTQIRTVWNEEEEEWYFAVVDVISALTGSENPTAYWRKLKQRLKSEGNETVTNCHAFKMPAADGKMRLFDAATAEQLLRLIQSIPSKKAEPFKLWLASVGKERIDETIDPELAIDRALETYLRKGYSEDWIHQRLLSIRIRNSLTDEWEKRGVKKGAQYAILTDEISKAWSGLSTRQYKNLKNLKKENLRDNMTDLELVLSMLAEASTTRISEKEEPKTFEENQKIAQRGGKIAGDARKNLESETGRPVVCAKNSHDFRLEDTAGKRKSLSEKKGK